MRLVGYGDFDWGTSGFSCGLPDGWMPFPSVEPVILMRPGTFATFGPSEIGELTIPATFTLLPENTMGSANTRIETAFLYLFKRLNPYKDEARQLRAVRNDGTAIAIPAKMRIYALSGNQNRNERQVDFVAVQPFWEALAPTVVTGTF